MHFSLSFTLRSRALEAILYFTADTRYKLHVNDRFAAIGPARSSPNAWYYDTLDISKHLKIGHNKVEFSVIRYFAASRHAMPFARTAFPGLTAWGSVKTEDQTVDLSTGVAWTARIDNSIKYPVGLIDDVFLHVCS